MEENGVDDVYASTVRRLLVRGGGAGNCCGSGCDPCVLTLQRTVDRVEELLAAAGQTIPST